MTGVLLARVREGRLRDFRRSRDVAVPTQLAHSLYSPCSHRLLE